MADRKVDPGFARNAKIIVIVGVVAVAGVLLTLVAMRKHNDVAAADIPQMTAKGGTPVKESPRYTASLDQSNREALNHAQETGGTFIPALSDNNAQIESALAKRGDPQVQAQPQKIDYQNPNGQPQQQQLPPLPAPSQGVGQQVTALTNQWDNPPSAQEVLGIQKEVQAAAAQSGAPAAAVAAAASSASEKTVLIQANARYYAHTENGINTDAPSDALAMLDQGPCKGGELRGAGKLTGDVVTVSYTTLTCNGKTYSVTAEALNPETLSNALPADINHHVISNIAVPAVLGALGTAGQVFANAGATVTNSVLGGTTVVQNPNPSPKQLEGAAVSGAVNGVQGVVQRAAAATPAITGTTEMNEPVIVLFKSDVTSQ